MDEAGAITRKQPSVFARFADDGTEARYNASARTLRRPFVRLYCTIFMAAALAYLIANPNLVSLAENARLAAYLGLSLLVAGGYICVTFWDGYVRHPIIDFVALILLSLLVGRANFVLFDYLNSGGGGDVHAVTVINHLVLTAFAAVTLAGRPWLFIAWLFADMLSFVGNIYADRQDAALALYLTKSDPIQVLRDLLGHSSVTTTEVYLSRLDTTRIFRELYDSIGGSTGLSASVSAEVDQEFAEDFAGAERAGVSWPRG